MTDKRFWIAHTRGPDFKRLSSVGFTVFYPQIDDYVFLEVTTPHRKHLKDELNLCVLFLQQREEYVTISEAELMTMSRAATQDFNPGDRVEVVSGFAEALVGEVVSSSPAGVECRLQGWNREYQVVVERLDLVRMKERVVER